MDPTGHDAVLRALAYGHPALMVAALGLAIAALRAGLRIRRTRRQSGSTRGLLVSALWLRNWTPFGTFHAWLGLLAATLFATAGWLGTRLLRGQERGDARARAARAHGLAGTLAVLAGAVAATAGLVLLP